MQGLFRAATRPVTLAGVDLPVNGSGASLARLEARIIGETLLRRGVHLVRLGGAERIDSVILRGFAAFPFRLSPLAGNPETGT